MGDVSCLFCHAQLKWGKGLLQKRRIQSLSILIASLRSLKKPLVGLTAVRTKPWAAEQRLCRLFWFYSRTDRGPWEDHRGSCERALLFWQKWPSGWSLDWGHTTDGLKRTKERRDYSKKGQQRLLALYWRKAGNHRCSGAAEDEVTWRSGHGIALRVESENSQAEEQRLILSPLSDLSRHSVWLVCVKCWTVPF